MRGELRQAGDVIDVLVGDHYPVDRSSERLGGRQEFARVQRCSRAVLSMASAEAGPYDQAAVAYRQVTLTGRLALQVGVNIGRERNQLGVDDRGLPAARAQVGWLLVAAAPLLSTEASIIPESAERRVIACTCSVVMCFAPPQKLGTD